MSTITSPLQASIDLDLRAEGIGERWEDCDPCFPDSTAQDWYDDLLDCICGRVATAYVPSPDLGRTLIRRDQLVDEIGEALGWGALLEAILDGSARDKLTALLAQWAEQVAEAA